MKTEGRLIKVCLALTLVSGAMGLLAQSGPAAFDAKRLDVPRSLDDGWVVRSGDDPSYADVTLDDSKWTAFKLDTSVETALYGAHPEVVWYRLHVHVDPTQTGVALREETLARAFEVYVNGERLIRSGKFDPLRPYTYNAPNLAHIPERMMATGQLVVALRVGITGQDWRSGNPAFQPEI